METRELNVVLLGLIVLLLGFSVYTPEFVGRAAQQCVDGDGRDFSFKGKVMVSWDYSVSDRCVEDTDIVQEFFCDSGTLQFTFFTCPGGCRDGACLAAPSLPEEGAEETFVFGDSGDQVEIQEYLGDVQESIGSSELRALEDGTLSTKKGATEYHQYLRFEDGITTGKIVFDENEDGDVGDYLYFKSTDYLFEYELEFEDGFASSVDGTTLVDLEEEELRLLGRSYKVAEAEKNGNTITLELVGGDHAEMLSEGESKTYHVGGKTVAVEVFAVDDMQREVTLKVNGQMSQQLDEGSTYVADGITLGIGDIILQESADGKDLVELFLGARTLSFRDDASDNSFSSHVSVDGTSISEGKVRIKGVSSGNDYKMSSLVYRLQPDAVGGGNVYVAPGGGARKYLDEPAAMLASWDIVYGGLDSGGTSAITLDPLGRNQYRIIFTNGRGNTYTIGLIYNNGGSLEISDNGKKVYFLEGSSSSDYIVKQGQYIVLTDKNTKTGTTSIVKYDSIDTTGKTVQFDELAEGSKSVTYTGTEGSGARGDLVIGGRTYTIFIGGAPDYTLAVDLDGDGDVDGSEAKIVTKGGGILDLGSSQTPGSDFTVTLTTEGSQFDENVTVDEVISIDVVKSGNDVDLSLPSHNALSIETETSKIRALSRYGVYLEKDNGNPDRLVITYPLQQSFGKVSVVVYSERVSSVAGTRCGNRVCDEDEGYMNCAADCPFVEIKKEEPVVLMKDLCGNGVCDAEESSINCPHDCGVYEEPAAVQLPPRKNWFARLFGWFMGLFA